MLDLSLEIAGVSRIRSAPAAGWPMETERVNCGIPRRSQALSPSFPSSPHGNRIQPRWQSHIIALDFPLPFRDGPGQGTGGCVGEEVKSQENSPLSLRVHGQPQVCFEWPHLQPFVVKHKLHPGKFQAPDRKLHNERTRGNSRMSLCSIVKEDKLLFR